MTLCHSASVHELTLNMVNFKNGFPQLLIYIFMGSASINIYCWLIWEVPLKVSIVDTYGKCL